MKKYLIALAIFFAPLIAFATISQTIDLTAPYTWTGLQTINNASTTNVTVSNNAWLTNLGTPAGTILAVDPNGKIIATTTSAGGVSSVTATFPILSTGGATPVISTAFGTTTNTGLPANSFMYTGPTGIILTVASSGLALPNTALANSTISGISLGNNLASLTNDGATLSGSSYNGSSAISNWAINLNNANQWTASTTFTKVVNLQNSSTTLGTFGTIWDTGLTQVPLYVDANGKVISAGSGTSGNCVKWGANNLLTDQGAACGSGGGGGDPFTHPITTTSATTALLILNGNASTTILSVSNGSATTTILGQATSTFGSGLSGSLLNITGNSTSTFNSGMILTTGCVYSVPLGSCLGTGGGGVSGGTNGMLAAWTGATTLTATSGPTAAWFTGTSTTINSTFPLLGVASTTGWSGSVLAVNGTTTFNGAVNHYGTVSCGLGGLLQFSLPGDEWCGNNNTSLLGVQRLESNSNSGNSAWGGYTLNNDLADNTFTHFGGLYLNSSGYTDTTFGTAFANKNQLTLQNTDGPLYFMTGTTTNNSLSSLYFAFIPGSTNSTDEKFRIASATTTNKADLLEKKTSGTAFNIQDTYGSNNLIFNNASTTGPYNLLDLRTSTSTGPLFAVDNNGHVTASSTTPVLSSCGTTPSLSSDSSDFQGTITVGSVAATACTLTFGVPHTTGTHCVISEQTGSVVNASSYTEGLTGFTYSQTGLTSDKLDYACFGQ